MSATPTIDPTAGVGGALTSVVDGVGSNLPMLGAVVGGLVVLKVLERAIRGRVEYGNGRVGTRAEARQYSERLQRRRDGAFERRAALLEHRASVDRRYGRWNARADSGALPRSYAEFKHRRHG